MDIVVCFKNVPDQDYLKTDAQSGKFNFDGVPIRISTFDRSAIEEAIRLKEKHGGKVTAITLGPTFAMETIREALAMGCDEGYVITDPAFERADVLLSSYLLSRVIGELGRFDLILCGEASNDGYTSLTGPSLAEWLGIPQITYVRRIGIMGDVLTAERLLENETEMIEASLPSLVSVVGEISEPRVPTVVQLLAARRKPVKKLTATDFESEQIGFPSGVELVDLVAVGGPRRKNIRIRGSNAEIADQLSRIIRDNLRANEN